MLDLPLLGLLVVALCVLFGVAAARHRIRAHRAVVAHRSLLHLAAAHGLPAHMLHRGSGTDHALGVALPDPFAGAAPTGPDGTPVVSPRAPLYVHTRMRGVRCETQITATLPSVPVALALRPELFGEALDKAVGTTIDHELGDPAFDRAFVVTAAPPDLARALLPPRARAALLALRRTNDSPRLEVRHDGTYAHLALGFDGPPEPARVMPVLTALRQMGLTLLELREGFNARSDAPFRAAAGESAVDPVARRGALAALAATRWRFAALVLALLGVGGVVVAATLDATLNR